jgi:AcrR family transcriptional regulator
MSKKADREGQRRRRADRAQERLDRAEGQVGPSMDSAEGQIERHMQRAHEQIERARERVESAQDAAERAAERARDAEPIWARPEPGSRSPRFSRELIAAKAMEIADADGIEAVSMRRVASELGAGTMTLYHYVGSKQELLDLMDDAMMAELLVDPKSLEGDWRDALRAIARASIETWARHPWLQEVAGRRPSIGPNGMRHVDQSLQAVADTGLSRERKLEIISQVDDYVAGYIQRERALIATPDTGAWNENWNEIIQPFSDYLNEQLAGGDYPYLEEFLGDDDLATIVRQIVEGSAPMDRFERGLDRLLDGVELEIKRAAERA